METYRLLGGKMIAKEELSARRFWLVVALDNSIAHQEDTLGWFLRHQQLAQTHDAGGITLYQFNHTIRSQ